MNNWMDLYETRNLIDGLYNETERSKPTDSDELVPEIKMEYEEL